MSKILGMEIGNDNLKLALCSGSKVQKLFSEKIPDNIMQDGMITIEDAMVEFLRDTRKKYRLASGTQVALVLPDSAAYTRKFTIPAMNDEELRLNLPYEFRDYLEQERGREIYVYDYCLLNVEYQTESGLNAEYEAALNGGSKEDSGEKKKKAAPKTPKEYTLLAAAMKKELLDFYANLLKKSGFKLKRAVPYDCAMQNLIHGNRNIPQTIAVLDIGAAGSEMNIYKDGAFVMGRRFDVGGRTIDDRIAGVYKVDMHTAVSYKEENFENCLSCDECVDAYGYLAVEAMKVINFYRAQGGDISDVYFAGGTSLIEMLRTRVVKATDMLPHDISKLLVTIRPEDAAASVIFPAAIGAAILK